MSDKNVKILYVDDKLDINISRFLRKKCSEDSMLEYDELNISSDMDIDSLIYNEAVVNADIIIIDNMLYENTTTKNRDCGVDIIPLLHYYHPYKRILVLTQYSNMLDKDIIRVSKWDEADNRKRSDEQQDVLDKYFRYYEKELWDSWIRVYIKEIKSLHAIISNFNNLQDSKIATTFTKDLVTDAEEGDVTYRNLTHEDVISLTEKLNEFINEVRK